LAVLTLNRGIVSSPNELTKPDGAAEVLDNCVIDFDNIVQSRRGFSEFGNKTPDDTVVKQLLTYKGRIFRHYSNKISFDSTGEGNFINFDGNYTELVNRLRIKYFELNSNLYFTTNEGIKKIAATSASDFTTAPNFITNAGGVKAISFDARVAFNASGFLPAQSKVAYKILWAKKDANNNVIRGVPTSRYVVTNTSQDLNTGESFKITVTDAGAGIHKQFNSTTSISGSVITIANHGFTQNTKVRFFGEIPSELNSTTDYFIVNVSNPNVFGVSLTEGGTAISLTAKVGIGFIYSGINNSNFFTFDTPTSKYACWFNMSGEDTPPTNISLVGRSLREVEIYKISTKNKQNYMARIAQTLFEISDIEVTPSVNNVTVLNRDGGDVLNASGAGVDPAFLSISDIQNGQTSVGTPANVTMTIPVPSEIRVANDKLYFFEIYRTAVITAGFGAGLDVIDPGEEMQKVFEGPVEVDSMTGLIKDEIIHSENVPESFREAGSFLYVNPVSGEGILQANEAPPIAHDVAVFKGSAFYANTKERHKLQINLLAVTQFPKTISYNINSTTNIGTENEIILENHSLNDGNPIVFSGTAPGGIVTGQTYYVVESVYEENINGFIRGVSFKVSETLGGTPVALSTAVGSCTITTIPFSFYISNSQALRTYTFIGNNQVIKLTAKSREETVGNSYFDINSAQNLVSYRVWFDKGNINKSWLSAAVNTVTNRITIVDHGLATNDFVSIQGTTLTPGDYYVIRIDKDTIQLKSTVSGSAEVLTSNPGSLSHTPQAPAQNGRQILKVNLPLFNSDAEGVANAFVDAFSDIFDFEVEAIGSGDIRITYTNNGEVDDIQTSSIAPGWINPVYEQTGIGEDRNNNEVLLSGLSSQALSIEETARSLIRVVNNDPSVPVTMFYLSSLDDLPGIILLESRSLLDDKFYLAISNETSTAIFEPSLPVVKRISAVTSSSPEAIITTTTTHNFTVGEEVFVFIDPEDVSPILSSKQVVSNIYSSPSTTFSLSGFTSDTLTVFDEALVFSASVVSDNSVNPNRIYFSKINQPEAVPLVNYIDIGPKDKAIQRILALRDSLIVLKEDGVYVISGSAAPNFSVRLSDSSALTFAPDTATNLNNLIYVLTTQGVVTVSETGVGVISRNIENRLQEIINAKFDYKLISWGMSSESDRCYLLWLPTKIGEVYATQAYRYNTFTRTWTRWTKPANCGIVNPSDDKIYLGDSTERAYILKERKNFERQDYADREIVRALGANAISGLSFTISSVSELEPGDVLVQKQYLDINKFNRFLKKLDRDTLASDNYFLTYKASTGDNLAEKLFQVTGKLQADGIAVPTSSNSNNINALRLDFNNVVDYLNSINSNTGFKNYKKVDDLLTYETLVLTVNFRSNVVTVNQSNKFIQGEVTFFKGIKCIVQYAPQHFGKPEAVKQVPDGTFIFDQNNFWGGTIAYSSDRSYDFTSITFTGKGPGYWNGYSWADAVFGGEGNEVPVRTLIPRDKSRCRYIHIQFTHINAREEWKLIGVSLEPREVSKRGYR